MSNGLKYTIDNLEWQQFELLAFKCLQIDVSPSILYLEGGHDKGRDFIYEGVTTYFDQSNVSNTHLFQAKHKSKLDDFAALKYDLVKELKKVYIQNKLIYKHYCLVTNLPLTANEYDDLVFEYSTLKQENNLSLPEKFSIYSYRQFETCLDNNRELRIRFPSIIQVADFRNLLEEIVQKPNKT